MPKEYPPEFFENKIEQARISLAILREMPTDVFYHNIIITLADLLQRMVHESLREEVFTKSHKSQLTQRAADVSAASHNKALCCCIPDQTKLDVQCQKSPEFEIWFGVNPSPDDNTLVCAEHLVEMLDDSDQFTVLRYVAAERR